MRARLMLATLLTAAFLLATAGTAWALPWITNLGSPTHPDSWRYYANGDLVLTWDRTPASLSGVGSLDTPGEANGIVADGGYAYIADGSNGLQIIDISDPMNATLAGYIDTPGSAKDVAVSGGYAYVADYSGGLRIIDIGDPANAAAAGYYQYFKPPFDLPEYHVGIDQSGSVAYSAVDRDGLKLLDVSDPADPVPAGSLDTLGDALDVAIAGDFAYVAGESAGLQIVDVSDPSNPILAGAYDLPDQPCSSPYTCWTEARDVVASGSTAFVVFADIVCADCNTPIVSMSASTYLVVLDVSDPANPAVIGSVEVPGNPSGLVVDGNRALITSSSSLRLADVSDPSDPLYVGVYDMPAAARGVAVSGDYAFVADGAAGLQVVDIVNYEPAQYSYILDQSYSTSPDTIPEGTATIVSYSGLPDGAYYFHVAVAENGILGPVSHRKIGIDSSCNVAPALSIADPYPFWSSYSDFSQRLLSVEFQLSNAGPHDVYAVYITDVSASNDVTFNSMADSAGYHPELPRIIGNLKAGMSKRITIVYYVPMGVTGFQTQLRGEANDSTCYQPYQYGG